MSEQVFIPLIAGLPAIILSVVALVKAFRSDVKATAANIKADEVRNQLRKT